MASGSVAHNLELKSPTSDFEIKLNDLESQVQSIGTLVARSLQDSRQESKGQISADTKKRATYIAGLYLTIELIKAIKC